MMSRNDDENRGATAICARYQVQQKVSICCSNLPLFTFRFLRSPALPCLVYRELDKLRNFGGGQVQSRQKYAASAWTKGAFPGSGRTYHSLKEHQEFIP